MTDITNPQAVTFCNTKARVLADAIMKVQRTLAQFMLDVVDDFEANTSGNQNGDVIADGAAIDGRQIITKLDIAAFKYVVEQIQACMNTDDRIAVCNKIAVNTQPHF